MKIYIKNHGRCLFEVGPKDACGSYTVGRGRTLKEALGDFLLVYQREFGIKEIDVEQSAQPAENARRNRALHQR